MAGRKGGWALGWLGRCLGAGGGDWGVVGQFGAVDADSGRGRWAAWMLLLCNYWHSGRRASLTPEVEQWRAKTFNLGRSQWRAAGMALRRLHRPGAVR